MGFDRSWTSNGFEGYELSLNKEETCLLKKQHAQWLAEYIP
jgi:hypothetical protein